MQLRKLYSVDDLPPDNVNIISGIANWPLNQAASWTGIKAQVIGGRKWITGINNLACLGIPLNLLGLLFTGKVVIGYRFLSNTAANSRTGSFHNSNFSTAFFDRTGAASGANLYLNSNQEYYIDTVLDFENRVLSTYIDGRILPSATVSTWTLAQWNAIISTYYTFLIGAYTGSTDLWYIRDLNVREYAPGEAYVPVASLEVARVPYVGVVNADYVTSNADTIEGVLNSNYTDMLVLPNGSMISPFVEAPKGSGASPLVLTLGNYDGIDGTPMGLEIIHTSKSMDATPAALTPKLTQNSVDLAITKQVLTGGFQYRKSLGQINTMPDGTAMTKAKIASSTLTFTPSVS